MAGLRLRTPELELRWPSLSDLDALADLADLGVHDPDVQPFTSAWTDRPPADRGRRMLQYHWSRWAAWKPSDWTMELAVIRDGTVVGTQGIGAREFAVVREVRTGSWLGRRYQGLGIGTQMRAAALHLAFERLGAQHATSGAFEDNAASLGVSRKLGYRALQWKLGLAASGVYGPDTKKALQRHLRVDADGDVGPVTIKALQAHVSVPQNGTLGLPTIEALQRALNAGTF
jgi:RimJ/RimL family protein N-acetyltransferase